MLKKLLAFLCALSLTWTSVPIFAQEKTASSPNEEFIKFINEDFKENLEDDYTTLHTYIANPENYDISYDNIHVTLGTFTTSKEDKALLHKEIKRLNAFDRNTLDATQQVIYDEYMDSCSLAKEMIKDKYKYLANIWSSNNGLVNTLNNYFANFEVYNEKDIEAFMTLLKDTKRYSKEAIAYSKQQAKENQLCFDYKETMDAIQTTLDNKDDNEILKNITKEIEALGLNPTTQQNYLDSIQNILDTDYYPSFTYIKKELKGLKNQVLSARPITSFKNGKAYYRLLVQSQASTSTTPAKILNQLGKAYDTSISNLQANSDKLENVPNTNFTSPNEIMAFLVQNYTKNMPEITVPEYDIQNLPDEQTSKNIVAYYITPILDQAYTNRIRFNAKDYGKDLSSIDTYLTFAHEGMPGHMYQYNYNQAHMTYNIQRLFSETAFSEGFAMFAEQEALAYLGTYDADQIKLMMDYEALNYYMPSVLDLTINLQALSKKEFFKAYKDTMDKDTLESLYETACYEPCTYLPYAYGYYKIHSFQTKAQKKLKDQYDNKAFVNALLENGIVNFDILDKKIQTYINSVSA